MVAKMAPIVDDVTGLQQRHYPKNIPQPVKKIKGFPPKVKSFRKTATYQKLRGGSSAMIEMTCHVNQLLAMM